MLAAAAGAGSARLLRLLAVLCWGLVAWPAAFADTAVSGVIQAATRWTVESSPYVVTGQVTVQNGAVLTIDPGVTVYMAAGAGLAVQAGSIRALGTTNNPIRVLSDKVRLGQSAAAGDWDQWGFSFGTINTLLENVVLQHGKGLRVTGSAPVFNYLSILDHAGAAVTIDLAASPTGVGNQASGNLLNGIAVPAGDISGSVRWGMRGIPYVVGAGTLSVGLSPTVASVSPPSVEQGQTVTLTLSGTRLAGIAKPTFDQAGLTATLFTGGSDNQAFVQLAVDPSAPTGLATLRLQVDAGEIVVPNAITIARPLPAITSISPTSVLAGAGATVVTVSGRNFASNSELLFNSASVPTQFVSATELRGTLPNQSSIGTLQTQVRTPDATQPGQYLLSNQMSLPIQAPVPPTVAIEPTPIALPPDSKPHEVTIRFSKADYRDNTLQVSISDTSKATVTPASVVIPAGQTTAKVSIVATQSGTVSLVVDSTTLARVSVPLFITADFRGANTSYAKPVGVYVEPTVAPETRQLTVAANALVGVAVGGVLTGASPSAWVVGTTANLTISGVAIPPNAQVSVVPSTGVTVGSVTVSGDGTQLQAPLTAAADAAVGARRLVVKDGAGKVLVFANPARAAVQLMTGLPAIDSIQPVVAVRGSPLTLLVRGRNLQQAAVRVLPETGVRIDAVPQISADGTTLTVLLDVASDAPAGDRVVQMVTPAGSTSETGSAANTLAIVNSVRAQPMAPIASRLVGVVVGDATTPTTATMQPGSSIVGVLVGAGITEVAPSVGVIGTDVPVTVRGSGLQGVTSVGLVPSTGVSFLATPTSNAEGTQLTFMLRIDAAAALGARRLVFTAGAARLTSIRAADGVFLVSAPVPELTAIDPQVLKTGQPAVLITARGKNLTNVGAVRIEPPEGITISGPFVTSSGGTQLTFNASAAIGAASGARTVIVTSAAGESTSVQTGGNIIRVATEVGPTYSAIASRAVGVVVGASGSAPTNYDGTLASPAVGVMVGATQGPDSSNVTAASFPLSVVVGSAATNTVPTGWLQGASGTITVTGTGLSSVTGASVIPPTGLLLGSPTPSGDGTQLTLTIAVAPDAPQVVRELRLSTASGRIAFVKADTARFGIGSMPTMSSLSPIVIEQGKGVTLTVRGSSLKGVTRVSFSPDSGVRASPELTWSQDALGELLTLTVYADTSAPLGSRVLRLEVPGGITTSGSTPANTINVVTPQ